MNKQHKYFITLIFIFWNALTGISAAPGIKPSSTHEVILKTKEGTICTWTCDKVKKVSLKNYRIYYGIYLNELFYKQGVLQGDPLNGKFNRYDLTYNVVETGNFRYGLKTGMWKHLAADGQLTETTNYRNGVLCGKRTLYENGVPVLIEKYRRGRITGKPKSLNAAKVLTNKKEKALKKKKVFLPIIFRKAFKGKTKPGTTGTVIEKVTNNKTTDDVRQDLK